MPGPRPIRFTAGEIQHLLGVGLPAPIMRKLVAATEPAPKGASVAPLEHALEQAAPGKVARLLPSGYARASKRAAQLGVTVEDVALVGRWLAPWYRNVVTLLDVLNRWDTWLPKARASAPPKGLPEGLGSGRGRTQGEGSGLHQGVVGATGKQGSQGGLRTSPPPRS